MYKEVTLLDENGNEINVPMKATAATPYRFRQTFHEEIPLGGNKSALLVNAMVEAGFNDLSGVDGSAKAAVCLDRASEKIRKLAYIMAMSAKGEKMDELNEEKYIDWIDGIDPEAFDGGKEAEIWEVYQRSSKNQSIPKK